MTINHPIQGISVDFAQCVKEIQEATEAALQNFQDDPEQAKEVCRSLMQTFLDQAKEQGHVSDAKATYAFKRTIRNAWVTPNGYLWAQYISEWPNGDSQLDNDQLVVYQTHGKRSRRLKQGPHAPRRHMRKAVKAMIGTWRDIYDVRFIPVRPLNYIQLTVKVDNADAQNVSPVVSKGLA